MNIAQHKLQLAQRLLSTEDKQILKAIELIFTQEDEQHEIPPEQRAELDKRLKALESGQPLLFSWEQAKKIIRKKSRR